MDRHQRKRALFYSLWFSLGFGHQQVSSENKTSSSKWRRKKKCFPSKKWSQTEKSFWKVYSSISAHKNSSKWKKLFSFYRTVCNEKNAMFADKHMAKSYYFRLLSIKQFYQGKRVPRGTHKPVSRWVKTHTVDSGFRCSFPPWMTPLGIRGVNRGIRSFTYVKPLPSRCQPSILIVATKNHIWLFLVI